MNSSAHEGQLNETHSVQGVGGAWVRETCEHIWGHDLRRQVSQGSNKVMELVTSLPRRIIMMRIDVTPNGFFNGNIYSVVMQEAGIS